MVMRQFPGRRSASRKWRAKGVGNGNDRGSHSTGYWMQETQNPSSWQEPFTRIDASLRFEEVDDAWTIAVIGRNLTKSLDRRCIDRQAAGRSGRGDRIYRAAARGDDSGFLSLLIWRGGRRSPSVRLVS